MTVLDASALIDVVIDQPWRDEILDRLDPPIASPAHQLAEVLSALARLVRADELTTDEARDALTQAVDLRQTYVTPDRRQLHRALALAGRIRVLDGLYVALAELRGEPLLTTDARLAASHPPCEVVLVPTARS